MDANAPKWSKSATVKITRGILGPFAGMKERDGRFILGLNTPKGFLPLAYGATPYECFHSLFLAPLRAMERIREEGTPEDKAALEDALKRAAPAETGAAPVPRETDHADP